MSLQKQLAFNQHVEVQNKESSLHCTRTVSKWSNTSGCSPHAPSRVSLQRNLLTSHKSLILLRFTIHISNKLWQRTCLFVLQSWMPVILYKHVVIGVRWYLHNLWHLVTQSNTQGALLKLYRQKNWQENTSYPIWGKELLSIDTDKLFLPFWFSFTLYCLNFRLILRFFVGNVFWRGY